jgi:3-hydroxymyristoyl/3-hydroxydecanoyl-(acyl carrier protein) dehydratase
MAATNAVVCDLLHAEIINSTISADTLELTLYISENLSCFAGHFPNFPILPGVMQLNWAVSYARDFFALQAPVMNVERLKFTCPIQPNMTVQFSISLDSEKKFAHFRYYSSTHLASQQQLTFSQGRLVYG